MESTIEATEGMVAVTDEEEQFQIDNDEKASWAIRKIRKREDEYQRLADNRLFEIGYLKGEIEHQEHELAKDRERCDRENSYLVGQLEAYVRSKSDDELHVTKTMKKYKLAQATLVVEAGKETVSRDEDVLLDWASKNASEFIRTKESVAWSELKKELVFIAGRALYGGMDGEVVEGVSVTQEPDKFKVDFNG